MAKLFKIEGFNVAVRLNRIDAVDRIKNDKGEEIVRLFISGMDNGYTLNFCSYSDIADKTFNDIVKAIEED